METARAALLTHTNWNLIYDALKMSAAYPTLPSAPPVDEPPPPSYDTAMNSDGARICIHI